MKPMGFDLKWFAQQVTSPEGNWLFVFIIAAFFLVPYGRLIIQYLRLSRQVRSAIDFLNQYDGPEAFGRSFEDFNRWIREHPLFRHAWIEFSETLVIPSDDSGKIIKNTEQPDRYFNLSSIADSFVNRQIHNFVPSALTGLGILFTFVGLACGIYLAQSGLTGDTESMKQALSDILGGASLAFSTSIAGLVGSLIYAWTERTRSNSVARQISRWCDRLEALLVHVTAEELLAESLHESKKQTAQLERFNTDLAISIAGALDERITDRILPSLQTLIAAVEQMSQTRSDSSETLIREMVNEFKSAFSGAAGSEMQSLTDILRALANQIGSTAEQLSGAGSSAGKELVAASDRIASQFETLSRTLTQSFASEQGRMKSAVEQHLSLLSGTIAELSSTLQEAGSTTSQSLIGAAGTASADLREASEAIVRAATSGSASLAVSFSSFEKNVTQFDRTVAAADALGSTFTNAAQQLADTLRLLREVHSSIQATASPLTAASSGIVGATKSLESCTLEMGQLSSQLNSTTSQLAHLTDRFLDNANEANLRFKGVDESLARTVKEITQGIEVYTSRMNDFIRGVDTHTGTAIGLLRSGIEGLDESLTTLEDLFDKLQKGLAAVGNGRVNR